jgi:hypothetical protein
MDDRPLRLPPSTGFGRRIVVACLGFPLLLAACGGGSGLTVNQASTSTSTATSLGLKVDIKGDIVATIELAKIPESFEVLTMFAPVVRAWKVSHLGMLPAGDRLVTVYSDKTLTAAEAAELKAQLSQVAGVDSVR